MDRLAEAFGQPVTALRPLHGGDLSEVTQATFADGLRIVVKRGPLVDREARMLQAIRATGAEAPDVLWQADNLLALEWLEETAPTEAGWLALGTTLRRLHAAPVPQTRWSEDYAFGPVRLDNKPRDDWASFWAETRLAPFLPGLPAPLARRLSQLLPRLPDHLGDAPLALLHGDLWTGNALFMAGGAALIDPACYHGDPEVDLAMLQLFGRPPDAFWQGYGAPRPGPGPEHAGRRAIYQLHPALVHHALFGAAYLGLVERLLDDSLA